MTQSHTAQDASDWWSTPPQAVLGSLQVDPDRGLSDEQVQSHRAAFGTNTLEEIRPAGIWELIIDGVKEPRMIVLLSIAALSFVFGKPVEALVMVFVVLAYMAVEFINKFRSDRIMTRLRDLTQPVTSVLRNGTPQSIPTGEVVVGDIVRLLRSGSTRRFPARRSRQVKAQASWWRPAV